MRTAAAALGRSERTSMTAQDVLASELAEARRRLTELEAAETDRRRAERVQDALYRIADLANAAVDMQEFYASVHGVVGELMNANNFYIALYDDERELISWPYFVDEVEANIPDPSRWHEFGSRVARGTTAYVLRTGEPQLLTYERHQELIRGGEIELVGALTEDSSWLGVPLNAGGRTIGVLVVQSYTKEVRYSEQDKELLAYVGQHIGAALSRARAIEETRQRNAELMMINSVQRALAGEIEPQALYDAVGDKLRDVFDAQVVDIAVYDETTGLLRFPYTIERGVRFPDEPMPLIGFRRHVMETREPLLINEGLAAESEKYGNPGVLSGEPSKSGIWMPLVAGGRAIGVISLQNVDREHAFTDSDRQLLATLARSLSVALENARLVHETRQRVAELATVNSVGQALAAQLELKALIELVGDRVRETFDADIAYVALQDEDAGRIDFAYYSEAGERRDEPSIEYGQGLTTRILNSREPLLLNRSEQYRGLGTSRIGTPSRSYLGVPIVVGETAIGVISVQSTREEGRFGEADAGLLATIAASVGVAIQNARLFEAQREAERQYRQLVEELPLTVYKDEPVAAAASEYISPRVEAMFGYPREAWSEAEFFASILHPEDRDHVIAQHGAALERGDDRWSFEYRLIAADGRTVFVRDDGWIAKDQNGTPTHVQGFMMDVTDQALAHAEIRRQKQYFESLVEVSPVAIIVTDAEERVTRWNPAATELFGYAPDEAIGRRIDDLVVRHDDLREEGNAVTRDALEIGRAHRITRRTRKDGALVDVEIRLIPLVVDGDHVGFYALYHDITELQRAREEAEAATQAKSAFLATMSHEIRTPMNAVVGMTDLLLGTELTPEQREFAEVVRTSGDALLHVIDDILDYSKIEAGKLDLEREPFDLRECLEGALEIVAPRASDKDIELCCLVDEGVPTGIVGDAARLRQVLLNLLSNAVKFTEEGEVVVQLDAEPLGANAYRLEFAVRDTGIGIPEERIDRLFESFEQVDASTTRRYGGTGLGLAISSRLVDLMGGTIRVESEQDKGSTFHISLTAEAAEMPPRIAPDDALPQLAGKRVLVVDDNATNREIVSRQLRSWRMEPIAVERPSEALALVAAGEQFDVGVLDLMMPDMDGFALAEEIRRHRSEHELPLLLLTSLGRLPHARSTEAFDAQLPKPLKASQLYNALVRLLTARAEEPAEADGDSFRAAATSSLRILLAEDNPVNQKVALRLLERLGYGADVASTGLEALAALERERFDVVLMDVQMPELDGLDAARRICERWPPDTRPRIIAMTANAMAEDREACFAAGMDDYLAKPIRPDELADALSRFEPRRQNGDEASEPAAAPLDAEALDNLRELGGDEFVGEVIDTFVADAPDLLATLRRSIADEDAAELRRMAHTLKSNGATFGAVTFADLCRELEQRAKGGQLADASGLADRIDREYGVVAEQLAALRRSPAS